MEGAINSHVARPSLLLKARRGRFKTLFVCLILLSLLTPVVESTTFGRILLYVLLCLNLLAAVFAISTHRRAVYVAATLLILSFFASTWATFLAGEESDVRSHTVADALTFAAFVYASVLILKDVISAGPVTTDKIFAAICVYLLAGIAWGMLYIVVFLNDMESFRFSQPPVLSDEQVDTASLFSHFCYYSFVTMTTLGYGDITPASSTTRMLSWLQAVLGQLYVAVLIARLVGLHTQSQAAGESRRDSERP